MNIGIYRIFNALGDSIILCSLFKALGVNRVTYNRAELDVIREVMKKYDLDGEIEFKQSNDPQPYKMVDYVRYMYDNNISLVKPNVEMRDLSYTTKQLGSKHDSARDRAMSLTEFKKFVKHPDLPCHDVAERKTIDSVYDLMQGSKHHISIDSGTAWLSASMGVPTTVYSKNSYYFADAYFYMKYLDKQSSVDVYQQDGKGVSVANNMQFNIAVQENKPNINIIGSYENYRSQVNASSRIPR